MCQRIKNTKKLERLRALTNYVDLQPHSIETENSKLCWNTFIERTQQKRYEGKGRAMLMVHAIPNALRQIQAGVR